MFNPRSDEEIFSWFSLYVYSVQFMISKWPLMIMLFFRIRIYLLGSFRVKLWAEICFWTIIRPGLGPKLDNWIFFRNYVKLSNDIIILVTCAVFSYNTDKQSSVKWWNFKWNFKKYKTRIWIVYGGPHGFLLLDIFISFSMQVLLTKNI